MSHTPPTEDEVFAHYAAVAKATALPICVYNNPGTTHVVLSEQQLGRLSSLASVQAVKMPVPKEADFESDLARLRAITPQEFAIGYSGDPATAPALLAVRTHFTAGLRVSYPLPCLLLHVQRKVAMPLQLPISMALSNHSGFSAGRS